MTAVDPHHFMTTKFDFGEAYTAASPSDLIDIYHRLDYCVPYHVEHFVGQLIHRAMRRHDQPTARVVDIGCSYGISALLLQQGLSYAELTTESFQRWHEHPSRAPHTARSPQGVDVVGTDPSQGAIDFCRRTAVQHMSWAGDLETESPPPTLTRAFAPTSFVLSSGAYGYISETSVCAVLDRIDDLSRVWVGNFALTPLSYLSSAMAFARYGLVTEAAPVLFPHRRFSSEQERRGTIASLEDAGMNADAERTHGYLFTRFYLSRPAGDAEDSLSEFWAHEIARHRSSTLVPDPTVPDFSFLGSCRA